MPLSPADQGLLDAARYGTGKLLAVWLKRGANPAAAVPLDEASRASGRAGFGVWHWLVDREHDALLHELRTHADTPFPLTHQDAWGNTAAHLAASRRPGLWGALWTPEVALCVNQEGDTALDVLRRTHPELVPAEALASVAPMTIALDTLDAPLLPPSSNDSLVVPPTRPEPFPADWVAAPTPDPSLPGEANISPEAWQRRLWTPDLTSMATDDPLLDLNAPEDPATIDPTSGSTGTSMPFVPPVVEWSSFALDAQGDLAVPEVPPAQVVEPKERGLAGRDSPHPGEQVLDPVEMDVGDAWVVDLEALLRPTSLLSAVPQRAVPTPLRPRGLPGPASAPQAPIVTPAPGLVPVERSPRPLPGPTVTTLDLPDLRLLDSSADAPVVPLQALDEHPDEQVGQAFIADPEAWTAQRIAQANAGIDVPASLDAFELTKVLSPAESTQDWAMAEMGPDTPRLLADPSLEQHVRTERPTATPNWTLVPLPTGPSDLAAAVAAQMARMGNEDAELKAPAWRLLPMTDVPVDPHARDGWDDAPVTLAPTASPNWALLDAGS